MLRIKHILIFILIVLLFSSVACATPSISTVQWTGDLEDNTSITINGSGFLTGPNVVLYESCEGGTVGNTIDASADIGTWQSSGTLKYDSEAILGTRGCRGYDGTVLRNYTSFSGAQEFFLSYWIKWPTGYRFENANDVNCIPVYYNDTSRIEDSNVSIPVCRYYQDKQPNHKIAWIYDNRWRANDDDVIIPAFRGYDMSAMKGNDIGGTDLWPYDFRDATRDWLNTGTWQRMSFYGQADIVNHDLVTDTGRKWGQFLNESSSHPGVHQFTRSYWGNASWTNNRTEYDPPEEFNELSITGYTGTVTPNARWVFDGIYLAAGDNSFARVEIGDSATYTSCRKLFFALPTSWSTNQIVANIQQGNFGAEQVYLFVTDKDGNRNATGKAITFATAGTPPDADTTDPEVTSITTTSPNGTYDIDDQINIRVIADEPVNWSLTVNLDTGGSCTITDTATTIGNCTYTVGDLENSSDLAVSSFSGSITDLSSNSASPPALPTGENLSDNANIIIDTGANTDITFYPLTKTIGYAVNCDNWPLAWSSDGNQYTAWGDGWGFGNAEEDKICHGFSKVIGDKDTYTGSNIWGGKNATTSATWGSKIHTMLAIGSTLYAFRDGGTSNIRDFDTCSGDNSFDYDELYKSTDNGVSWTSTGVRFDENDVTPALPRPTLPAFIQFDQGNTNTRDSYIYTFWPEVSDDTDWDVQKPGRIFLSRVPASTIETEADWQWYTSTTTTPSWGDIANRQPVFTDATNGVMRTSIVYNYAIGRYIFLTQQVSRLKASGAMLGIYSAPEPWGPWTQMLFADPWTLGLMDASMTKTVMFHLSQKWSDMSGNIVLVYTDQLQWATVEGLLETDSDTSPPVISNASPNGMISHLSEQWLSLETDEPATCKFSTTAGTSYASMENLFENEHTFFHADFPVPLEPATTYTYYVRCMDSSDNANTSDEIISFHTSGLMRGGGSGTATSTGVN